jgi:antibiotic biosynthesis monooxygenase (ABM) superfamily enzyme
MPPIHVAITRRVKPGREADFEAALLRFFQQTMFAPGVLGAQVVRPASDSIPPFEYGVLRTFESEAARDAFYASEQFAAWDAEVEPLLCGDHYERRNLHGLEAFFRGQGAPPRWKMGLLTWTGVFPSVLLWTTLFKPVLPMLPHLLGTALVTVAVTITLTWAVMPLLTRLFHGWLRPGAE